MEKPGQNTHQQKEKVEEKHSIKQMEPQYHSSNPQMSIGETPFIPQIKEHISLLSSVPSGDRLGKMALQLQQTYGNRYVSYLLRLNAAQAKLTVSDPHDTYEQEADRVAEQVVRSVNHSAQRQSEEGEEEEIQTQSLYQRMAKNSKKEVDSSLEDQINAAKGGGQALDKSILSPMEGAFGADFSQIKVHSDANADSLSQSLQARAFTTSKDIFFKHGEYNPESSAGQQLLAHELTHTIQQGAAGIQKLVQRKPPPENKKEEKLKQEKAPEKPETKKSTPEGTVPVKDPDKSTGPDTYLTLVQNAKFIKASGGGLGGVFFLYPEKPVEGKKVNPDVVVKFEPGEAVRGKFAENLLAAGGFEVTRSLVYRANSNQGKKVKSKIEEMINNPQSSPQEEIARGRIGDVSRKTLNQGKAVIVSDFIPSLGTFADLMAPEQGKEEEGVKNTPETEQALTEAFNNVENAVELGKLLVFDAMLGNQDRLEAMNLANVMLAKRGGKWTFVLIDNDAEVPTMLTALGIQLSKKAEKKPIRHNQIVNVETKLSVKEWVKNLIEGGPGELKKTAGISFINDAGASAVKMVNELKGKYLSTKGMGNVMKAIDLGQLQRGIMHGINEGGNAILNISSKTLKKMLEQETKSLGKSGFLSAYGLDLKWHYIQMVYEQKEKHEEAMAEIEAMVSKKIKELTGNADYVNIDPDVEKGIAGGITQKGKTKIKIK
jgi:hypothetical protein